MKNITIILIFTLSFLFRCTTQPTEPEIELDHNLELGKLSLNLDISNAPSEVVKMRGMVWNKNRDTIFFDFKIKENFAMANIEELATEIWILQVDAYNSNNLIIYTGSTKVNVKSGTTTIVQLHLNPLTGGLEIIVTWGERTVTDIDGNIYKTVKIGNQIWMAENLKVTRYRNGDPIPDGSQIGDYSNEIEPQYRFAYNDNERYVAIYGRLYTWYVVNDERNICPIGWHIPSDEEYRELELYLGMSELDTGLICSLENNIISGKLKERGTLHWNSPNVGATNESGFTALPAGYRQRYNDNFDFLGSYACFWTSTEHDGINAWYRHLYSETSGICRTRNLKNYGFSIRCVKN